MINLVCLLEEPSAAEMLKAIVPRIFPGKVDVITIPFEGKQDLEKQLVRKLRYWRKPNSCFLVMRDQDAGDCRVIKAGLLQKVADAGRTEETLVRVACKELESFYFGDLAAVEAGLEIFHLARYSNKAKYRTPDAITMPSDELAKITDQAYQKIAGSRAIAPHLSLDGNRSNSFNQLISGLRRLVASMGEE
jgi:hypothetical protein